MEQYHKSIAGVVKSIESLGFYYFDFQNNNRGRLFFNNISNEETFERLYLLLPTFPNYCLSLVFRNNILYFDMKENGTMKKIQDFVDECKNTQITTPIQKNTQGVPSFL